MHYPLLQENIMSHCHKNISLGFTDQKFPPGVHVCQIYTDDNERQESVLKFLLSGLQAGGKTSCFSENVSAAAIRQFLEAHGISYEQMIATGAFTLSGTNEVYFHDGRFDPERMLSLLKEYHVQSLEDGFPEARVIGEMTPEVQHLPGGDSLLEYESKVSLLLQEHPVTAVCQYSANDFSGDVIMDILKVHPYMVVRGSVVHNPFFITPEEFLAR